MSDYKKLSKTFVLFIDLLYAVVTALAVDRYYRPIISGATSLNDLFLEMSTQKFGFFILSFCVVGRDWINYHSLIDKRPHKTIYRFVIDILILFSFVSMLQKINSPLWFLGILALYFLLLIIWSAIELFEYKDDQNNKSECKNEIFEDIILLLSILCVFIFVVSFKESFLLCNLLPYIVCIVITLVSTIKKRIQY